MVRRPRRRPRDRATRPPWSCRRPPCRSRRAAAGRAGVLPSWVTRMTMAAMDPSARARRTSRAGGCSCGTTRPTTGRRAGCRPTCARPRTRSTATSAPPTRSSTARAARRPPRRAGRRSTPGRRSCAAAGRRAPGGRRAHGRRCAPRPPARRARRYMRSMRVDCGRVRIEHRRRARRPTWTARRARSAGSWRRCSACPSASAPTSGTSARRSSSRTSSATSARTGTWTAIYLPAEDREAGSTRWIWRRPRHPRLRAAARAEVARARALFAAAEPAVAAAPGLGPHRHPAGLRRLRAVLDRAEAAGGDVLGRRVGVRAARPAAGCGRARR